MKFCIYCGATMEEGTRFCGGCGKPTAPAAPPPPQPAAPQPVMAPPQPAFAPPPMPQAPPQPAFAPPPMPQAPPQPAGIPRAAGSPGGAASSGTERVQSTTKSLSSYGTTFEVIEYEMYRMGKVTLQGTSVVLESGLLHYWMGQIQMQANAPSLGGMAKSFLTKEKMVRPIYSGMGEVYLEPTFGDIGFLDLNGQEVWILDKGAYMASDQGVQLGMYTNPMFNSFFGGEGMFQTQVSGVGKVMYWSPGPVQRVELQGQTLTVDGSFAVGRTSSLDYRVEKATKGLFRSMMSGEGLVNVFSGYGSVLLAPMPNRYMTLLREFGGLHAAIRSISRS